MSQLTIYLKPELAQKIRDAATSEGVSQSSWIAKLIEEKLEAEWPAGGETTGNPRRCTAAALSQPSVNGGVSPSNMGKWRTLRVASRNPRVSTVAAIR